MTFDVTRSPRRCRRDPRENFLVVARVANFVTPRRHRFWPWKGAPGHPATIRVKLYAVDAWNDMLEAQKGAFVAKYGATFYNGFRAFYVVCAEAFAANNGNEFMCAYYTFVKVGA